MPINKNLSLLLKDIQRVLYDEAPKTSESQGRWAGLRRITYWGLLQFLVVYVAVYRVTLLYLGSRALNLNIDNNRPIEKKKKKKQNNKQKKKK